MYRNLTVMCIAATLFLLTGCSSAGTEAAAPADDSTVEYNGIYKKKSELSEDTLKWLEWYHSLPEEQQMALSMVPSEFIDPSVPMVIETPEAMAETGEEESPEAAQPEGEPPSYLKALTQEELDETSELARYYFTEKSPEFGGVEQLAPAEDSYPLYRNTGIEASYGPGNIIIYLVHTTRDIRDGNPVRSISIARKSKTDQWKVINSGF